MMQSKQTDSHDWHVPRRRINASPCTHAWQGECWPLASSTQGCCHPDRPASDDCCVCPLWRTQLGSGKVSSSNSSSRNSRTSSSSSSRDKTKQGKTRQYNSRISGDTLAIPRRYPKMEKRTPRHQSPSSFQHNHISKFQSVKPNAIKFPMVLTQ